MSKPTRDRELLQRWPHNYNCRYLRYDYLLNEVPIAIGALAEPLYYHNATASIVYGGLGSAFATELVRAFDDEGIQFDDLGSRSDWWSMKSLIQYRKKQNCILSGESVFPQVPALEVTYKAYKEVLARDPSSNGNLALAPVQEYTGEQIFFLTFCHVQCRLERGTRSSEFCNKAVKNFPPFAEAFLCSEGSNMNPVRKCPFFP